MDNASLHARFEEARKAVQQASIFLLSHEDLRSSITAKAENDYVTSADKECERLILSALAGKFPEDSFLGEESGTHGESRCRWIIDPIDGTVDFMASFPNYTISVAFEDEDGLAFGIVMVPRQNEEFSAFRGEGAWLNGKRIHTDETTPLKETLAILVPPHRHHRYLREYMERMERFYYGAEEIDAAADIDLAAVPEAGGGEADALMHDMDAQPLCAIPGTSAGVIAAVYCEGELVVIIDEPPGGGTYSHIYAELVTPEGERLTMLGGSSIESDKYRRERTNIAVSRDVLAGSTLRFSGTKYSVLEGEWEIPVDFGEAEGVLERALDIDAGGELLEDCAVTVSPLGVSLSAPGFDPGAPHERMDIASLKVILTTADGEKDMTQRCSILYTAGRARACWPSAEALDISQVKSLQLGETVIRF